MEWITVSIALAGIAVALTMRPVWGLVAYLAVLLLYPDYLRVSIGTIDISASRLVVCVLLMRCVFTSSIVASFRWTLLDSLVAVSMVVYAVTLAFTTPFEAWIENRAGFIIDTFFAYLAIRFVVVDRPTFVVLAKSLAVVTLILAVHAVVESLTGKGVYSGLGQYCPWAPLKGVNYRTRFGLNRAMGSFGDPIMFGLYFAMVVPILWTLRHERPPWKGLSYLFTAAGIGGVAATVSSGSYVALGVVLVCLALERSRRIVKPLVVILIVGCASLEIASDRHFYEPLIDRLAMDASTGWYRSRLIEVAVKELPKYWTVGFGFADPGWGPMIDGRDKTDGVNDYVTHAVVYGVLGLVAFIAVLCGAMRAAIRSCAVAPGLWERSAAWSLGSALLGMIIACWSVAVFAQTATVFYGLVALHGSIDSIVHRRRAQWAWRGAALVSPPRRVQPKGMR